MTTETFIVRAMRFGSEAKVEITVYVEHPARGRVSANKRVRIPADKVLEVASMLIEAQAACRSLVADQEKKGVATDASSGPCLTLPVLV